jgi:hypothetical protein
MATAAGSSGEERAELIRLSVVLDERLLEFVRVRAFESRKSKSAYVRDLIAADADRHGQLSPDVTETTQYASRREHEGG